MFTCDHILIRRVIELLSEATLFSKTIELLKQSISFHAKPITSQANHDFSIKTIELLKQNLNFQVQPLNFLTTSLLFY